MTGRGKARRLTLGWRKLLVGLGCAGLAAGGVCLARGPLANKTTLLVAANPPAQINGAAEPATPASSNSDYSHRFVASFGDSKEGVTQEELGEYLIARFGAERLPLLINKILIEEACRAKGIEVTAAEVEASFAEDLAGMGNVSQADFADKVLKQYKKSLYEWKEDVIRPKLLMSKLVRDRVKVTEEDIQAGFDAYHGEKIDCQVIYWPRGEENIAKRSTPPSATAPKSSTTRRRCRPTAHWRLKAATLANPSAVARPATTRWKARRSSCNPARSADLFRRRTASWSSNASSASRRITPSAWSGSGRGCKRK